MNLCQSRAKTDSLMTGIFLAIDSEMMIYKISSKAERSCGEESLNNVINSSATC